MNSLIFIDYFDHFDFYLFFLLNFFFYDFSLIFRGVKTLRRLILGAIAVHFIARCAEKPDDFGPE